MKGTRFLQFEFLCQMYQPESLFDNEHVVCINLFPIVQKEGKKRQRKGC